VSVPRDKRHSLLLHIPKTWQPVLDVAAKARGMNRAAFLRWAIAAGVEQTSGMGRVRLPPDDLGTLKQRRKLRGDARRREMRRLNMAAYRARKRAKDRPVVEALVFRFDDVSGVVRASDLDALGSCVGVMDERGCFTFESGRHQVNRWLDVLAMEVEAGRLVSERWKLFLRACGRQA
jgi:hypothetical protein